MFRELYGMPVVRYHVMDQFLERKLRNEMNLVSVYFSLLIRLFNSMFIFQIPAPRLSRTPALANVSISEPDMGANTDQILSEFGYGEEDIESMKSEGIVHQTDSGTKSML